MAEAIGRLIGRPERTRPVPASETADVLPYANWLGGTIRVDAGRARRLLRWVPRGPELLDDIEHGSYRSLIETRSRDGSDGHR